MKQLTKQTTTNRLTVLKLLRDKTCKVSEPKKDPTGKTYWVAEWTRKQKQGV